MAPKVTVPMDFGRHLLRSPTHNNLTLNTKDGQEVTASSVILSFNSPVIDHMTTTLHMTSVDMLEFSEAAVRIFVDSAYSGTADEITRETFRDFNKISSVFKVEWLVEKCFQYFSDLSESVKVPNYTDLLFLFEEGAYAYENLKRKNLLEIGMKKIQSFSWKSQFFEEYLIKAERLSKQKLDMVIELAGNDVESIVQILTRQLTDLVLNQGLPTYCEYLLENSDLSLCRQSNKLLFDELFDMLDNLPDEKMRWTYGLLKKNSKKNVQKCDEPTPLLAVSTHPLIPSNEGDIMKENSKNNSENRDDPRPVSTFSLIPRKKKPNMIPNLYHSFDMDMSFDEVYQWLLISDEIDSIILAIEAITTWNWYRCFKKSATTVKFDVDLEVLQGMMEGLRSIRGWCKLPHSFSSYHCLGGGSLSYLCSSSREETTYLYLTPELSLTSEKQGMEALRSSTKLMFRFKHPAVGSCNQPGQCGFILETVRSSLSLWKLRLCTKEDDYASGRIHFHNEIRAENMHVFVRGVQVGLTTSIIPVLYPLTWLGFLWNEKEILEKLINWTRSSSFRSFGVFYKV